MDVKNPEDVKEVEIQKCFVRMMASGEKIQVVYIRVPPGVEMRPHPHPGESVGYILSGELELYTDKHPEKITVKAGSAQLFEPNEAVGGRNPGKVPAEFLCIETKRSCYQK
jgi:quercetin dioxygenase-like cupin family protein